MKILVYRDRNMGGCVLYRQHAPHMNLAKNYKDVFIKFTSGLEHWNLFSDDEISDYDIIQFHKGYFNQGAVETSKRNGLYTVVDFDDYWDVPYGHLLYDKYRRSNTPKFFEGQLSLFDAVTVTTPWLADAVRPFNKNVYVLPNAIDPGEQQFAIREVRSERIRFGWIGGVCHLPDIELMRGLNNRLNNSELKDRYTLNIFGYQKDSIFDNYCDVLTDNGKYLGGFQAYPNQTAETYTQYYNFLDVALVPLVDNKFNNLKSELKLIEAGFFKKATIVSDVLPYSPILTDKNCLRVRKRQDWFKHIKYLINNPGKAQELGENLHETVKDKFNQNTVSKTRYDLYKCLIQERSSRRVAV